MNNLKEFGFYHLRTPLFPINNIFKLFQMDEASVIAVLKSALQKPYFKELIHIASPSLFDRIKPFISSDNVEDKDLLSFFSYYVRACSRCTPFGIAAGTSVGRVTDTNEIVLEPIANYKRHVRLDLDLLWNLGIKLGNSTLKESLIYRPNNTIHNKGSRIGYVKYTLNKDDRKSHLVNVENSVYIEKVLSCAEQGANINSLAGALIAFDDSINYEEASFFINTLIGEQLLLSDLEPKVTGKEYMYQFQERLQKYSSSNDILPHLEKATKVVKQLNNTSVGSDATLFEKVADALNPLGLEYKAELPFQVDMVKPTVSNSLNQKVTEEVKNVMRFLSKYKRPIKNNTLEVFKDAFGERYGHTAEVPLLEALDPENGIGYPVGSNKESYHTPLVEDIITPEPVPTSVNFADWEEDALSKYARAFSSGAAEVILTDKDTDGRSERVLPESLAAMFSLLAESDDEIGIGNFQLIFNGVNGPSAAMMLARFCYSDEELYEEVQKIIEQESSSEKNAILAEVVYVSSEGTGNILQRPTFRNYEIPILAQSGVDEEYTIRLDDLMLSIQYGKCCLRSKKLNRQIKPRITNAHNYTNKSLMYYRFLGDVHHEDVVMGLGWNWGLTLDKLNYLPRVRYGKTILSKARWTMQTSSLPVDLKHDISDKKWFDIIQTYRKEKAIPKFVSISFGGDNTMLLDLTNPICLKVLKRRLKQAGFVLIEEYLFTNKNAFVKSEEGSFANEFVLTFKNLVPKRQQVPPIRSFFPENYNLHYTPTSEWLYAKIYCGFQTADFLLENLIKPLTEELIENKTIDSWYFIRYRDPDAHLRIRFKRTHGTSFQGVMRLIEQNSQQYFDEKLIHKIQYDTYLPETLRYGFYNMENSETLFCSDSICAINILSLLDNTDEGKYLRSVFAMKSIDSLLNDFKLSLKEKKDILEALSHGFALEFNADKTTKKQLASKYREYREVLDRILGEQYEKDSDYESIFMTILKRSTNLSPIVKSIMNLHQGNKLEVSFNGLIRDYIHMLMNRFMMTSHRFQEMVVYDLMYQHYKSQLAREKQLMKQQQ